MSYDELVELRKMWERGCEVIVVLPHFLDNYTTIYVLLKNDGKHKRRYCVNRYFKIGNKWNVSADKQNISFDEAIAFIHEEFEDIYIEVSGKLEKKKEDETT